MVTFFDFFVYAQEDTFLSHILDGHSEYIGSIRFSPDAKLLASVGGDKIIKIWDVIDGSTIRTFSGHSELIFGIDFSPDGKTLASCSFDQTVKLWDVTHGTLVGSISGGDYPISEVKFSTDGKIIAGLISKSSYYLDSVSIIKIWEVGNRNRLVATIEPDSDILSFIFNSENTLIATSHLGQTIRIWNARTGESIDKLDFSKYDNLVYPLAFTNGGETLFCKSNNFLFTYNIEERKIVQNYLNNGEWNFLGQESLAPDQNLFVTCNRNDSKLKFWQVNDGTIVTSINTTNGWVREIQFSPDGNLIATGHQNGRIEIWDIHQLNIDINLNIPKTSIVENDAIAVVIGNKDYKEKDIPSVEYAINDVKLVKKYLINTFGFNPDNILYYENATQSDLYSLFGSKENYKGKLYNYVKEGKSDVFVYYSGHGAPDPESKQGYFVPIDCDPYLVTLNGYSLNTFYENLSKINYKSLTVVIDACFSGSSDKGTLLKNVSPVFITVENPFSTKENTTVFTSASGDQVSSWYPEKRHSLFTYYFLKGLKGEADLNTDKTITIGEMKNYIMDNVPYMARRLNNREQTPQVIGLDNEIFIQY